MNEILSAMSDYGLNPGTLELDGKMHKFKVTPDDHKKSGWYIGWQNHARNGGEVFYVVEFGNYRENLRTTFKSDIKYSRDDRKHIKSQMDAAKKKEAENRTRINQEAAAEVAEVWEKSLDDGTSGYLVKKQIDNQKLGIKFNGKGDFYVPMRDIDGKLWSMQRIFWSGERWEKRFHAGGRVVGCAHIIGKLESTGQVFIAEGFATAASIHIATGGTVVVAFTSGNLGSVARDVRKKYPNIKLVICGDDDCFKDPEKNPGREAATTAAKQCFAGTAFPIFASKDGEPTDFNDLHVREGIEKVREQLKLAPPPPSLAVYPLGFDGQEVFFTSTTNRQVNGFTKLTEKDFYMLAPIDYWEAAFPGAGASRVDWSLAKSSLIEQAKRKGIFKLRHVRGAGVWNDKKRVVINMGDHLVVDGVRVGLGEIESTYFYTLGANLSALHPSPLSVAECKTFLQACEKIKWTKKDSGLLLVGALVASRVCGALPVRPHAWITGGAQTGKTTILERIVRPIMGPNTLYVFGNTTEAGIRQELKADAVPILFDEFETTGAQSAEKIAAVIDLARASWADSGATIVKGGSGGNASHFTVRFAGVFSSIRTKLINDADKGRFLELEMAPHGSDPEHWKELSQLMVQIDLEYSERLFARTIQMLPTMLHNFKLMKVELAKRANSRFGDQYGMVLAAYSIMIMDEPFTEQDAEWLADQVELVEEKEVAKVADHDDALTHMLTTKVQFDRQTFSIRELIGLVWGSVKKNQSLATWLDTGDAASSEYKKVLSRLGIRVDSDFVAVVSCNHAELERTVWTRTNWSKTWGNSLSRLPGAVKKKYRIGGITKPAICIPINMFEMES